MGFFFPFTCVLYRLDEFSPLLCLHRRKWGIFLFLELSYLPIHACCISSPFSSPFPTYKLERIFLVHRETNIFTVVEQFIQPHTFFQQSFIGKINKTMFMPILHLVFGYLSCEVTGKKCMYCFVTFNIDVCICYSLTITVIA